MSRDRIADGILDQSLSERLQLDPDLTLKKAIDLARNAETVKIQQKVLREPQEEGCIEAKVGVITSSTQRETKSFKKCNWCGSKKHERSPARQETVIVSCEEKKYIMPECVNLNADLVFEV